MKRFKVILKVLMIFVLFVILLQIFRAIGFATLRYTNLEFGENIRAFIEILSFMLSLFLSIKSFKNKKYLKGVVIGIVSIFVILISSIIITKVTLQNSLDTNSSISKSI
jgi:ABC-type sugar transport system permease subunit